MEGVQEREPPILKLLAAAALPKETEIPIPELREFVDNTRIVPEDFSYKDLVNSISNKEPIISSAINEGHLALIYFYFCSKRYSKYYKIIFRELLIHIAKYGYLSTIEFLIKNKQLLQYASRNGHFPIVKFLVANGADIHEDHNQALRSASWHGHLSIVEFLVKDGADLYTYSNILNIASRKGHIPVIKFLVENGKYKYENYYVAIRHAVFNGHTDVVEFLQTKLKTLNNT